MSIERQGENASYIRKLAPRWLREGIVVLSFIAACGQEVREVSGLDEEPAAGDEPPLPEPEEETEPEPEPEPEPRPAPTEAPEPGPDGDYIPAPADTCPNSYDYVDANGFPLNRDGDNQFDSCDTCPDDPMPAGQGQHEDADRDGFGAECDWIDSIPSSGIDHDSDGVPDEHDNCDHWNPEQMDADDDGIGIDPSPNPSPTCDCRDDDRTVGSCEEESGD